MWGEAMEGRSGALAVLCLLAACSSKDDGKRGAPTSRASSSVDHANASAFWTNSRRDTVYTESIRNGAWYQTGSYRMRSLVPDAAIVPIHGLPGISHEKSKNDFCSRYNDPPGAEARSARRLGWRTDYDGSFGQITFVNMFRHYEYVGALCYQDGARLVLFDRGAPIAVIISGARAEGAIGWIEKMESGALRLENSLGDAPFGDLFLTGRDIEIRPLPAADTVCNGRHMVPNVFGMPIEKARRILGKAGWAPVTAPPPIVVHDSDSSTEVQDDLGQIDLYRRGIKEVTECNPMGFCTFSYRSNGARLDLSTHGNVNNYGIDCASSRST